MSGKQRRLETSAAHYYQVGFYFYQVDIIIKGVHLIFHIRGIIVIDKKLPIFI